MEANELGIRDQDLESLSSFYFLAFRTNPVRQSVKIWIDDGSISFYMKYDKFFKIISELCNDIMRKRVQSYCSTYGEMYLIDRDKQTITQLNPKSEIKNLTAKEIKERSIAKDIKLEKDNNSRLFEQSQDSLVNLFSEKFSLINKK